MSTGADISIIVPAEDLRRFSSAIIRLVNDLKMSEGDAVKWGAFTVARSLRASTRKSPKKRKVERNPGDVPQMSPERFPHYVKRYVYTKNGKLRETEDGVPFLRVYLKDSEEAGPKVTIKRSGLGKASWGWAVQDIGRRLGGPTGSNLNGLRWLASGEFRDNPLNPSVLITNRVRYIMDAMDGEGSAKPFNTAFARAASAMEKHIERKLQKAGA